LHVGLLRRRLRYVLFVHPLSALIPTFERFNMSQFAV
jgi:hypothetical protein